MSASIEKLKRPDLLRSQCLIGGEWVSGAEWIDVRNPFDGSIVAKVPRLGAREADQAIAYGAAAAKRWAKSTAGERATVLRRWFDLVQENLEDLAILLTLEQGKPLHEARAEISYAASYIEWFSEEARRGYGDIIPSNDPHTRQLVIRQPVGLCAAITPWNFPSGMVTRKVAPALAAGCAIIVKPAEQTPLSALALAYLASESGLPAGILQVITGSSRAIGAVLTSSHEVRKLTFTGSTEVGRVLAAQCAPSLKKLSLELGGNAPFIVFEDADLDKALQGLMQSKFRNAGQTCVCTNRILVQESIHDEFAERLAAEVMKLRVGDGLANGVDQGPLIDSNAHERMQLLVDDALASGGNLLCGGSSDPIGRLCFAPTVISRASPASRVATDEIFGPLAALYAFRDEEEAIEIANSTEYGLAGYVFTRSLARAWRVSEALECGMVGINAGLISSATVPFGGVKQSGYGREGSKYGLDDYTELKYLCMAGLESEV
ncbi:NAD-dependent succinate-semialdehyde dehydrogenase [Cupriavidus necator]|uniref:NAD-dependent succinate-semialdehyde dehydrogenase n=1 Tax=Cupriavidus necator TaxID=106590 RepID=UPI002788F058|nr:NAD-dependent succinate-semialdehyde dehydrogenase [Cupriavidus necator]MDQ0141191.1 succinate-semialdehyde dehydrogenase/glutarate-semialdehyde dehydrogenase [Cupriavidus necator]